MSQKFAVMIAYDDDPNVKRYSPDFQTQDEFAKGKRRLSTVWSRIQDPVT